MTLGTLVFKMAGILMVGLVYGLITAFLLATSLDRQIPWYSRLGLLFALLVWLVVGVTVIIGPKTSL